jgi:hypothetical protein
MYYPPLSEFEEVEPSAMLRCYDLHSIDKTN